MMLYTCIAAIVSVDFMGCVSRFFMDVIHVLLIAFWIWFIFMAPRFLMEVAFRGMYFVKVDQ